MITVVLLRNTFSLDGLNQICSKKKGESVKIKNLDECLVKDSFCLLCKMSK